MFAESGYINVGILLLKMTTKVSKNEWVVYLLECLNGSLYTGVTNDIERRMEKHSSGRGSKYVRANGFGKLVAKRICLDKSDACRKEYHVKTLSRDEKINWFR